MPAVVATAVLLIVTRRGAYVSPDSLAYVGTARNLLDGGGYRAPPGSPPLSNFPPLYPLLLAAVGAFGPDPLTVARYIGPLLLGLTVLVAGLLVRRVTGSMRLALAAQLLLASGTDLLAFHSAALSEPLFLLLALLALVAVAASLRSRGTWLVFVAALLAGMATITRYVGLAVIVAGAAAFVFVGGGRRWKSLVAFAFISLAPLATWMTWVSGASGRATNRTMALHAPDGEYFGRGTSEASTWVLPGDVPWPIRLAVAVPLVLLLLVAWWRRRRASPAAGLDAPRVFALFALAYLLALIVNRWLFEVTGRLDDRFLLPVHVVAVVLALRALSRPDGNLSNLASLGLSAVVGLQLAAGGFWLYDAATDADVRPGGFTAPAWHESSVMEAVRTLPPSTAVFTNQADALYFHTGREAQPIPDKADFFSGEPKPSYEAELEAMLGRLGRDGVVAYFTASPSRRVFLPSADELAARLRLETVLSDEVGMVLRPPRTAA